MNIQNQSNRTTIRNLVIFTTIVLGIGWIGRGLDVMMGNPSTEGLGILLWLVTPLAVSLLLRAFARGWLEGFWPQAKLQRECVVVRCRTSRLSRFDGMYLDNRQWLWFDHIPQFFTKHAWAGIPGLRAGHPAAFHKEHF